MNGYELVDDFYVRCPSNVNQEGITTNVSGPAHFQFKLSHPINLENNEDWFVALHELFIPKHHYNVYNDFNKSILAFDFIDLEARKQEVERLEQNQRDFEEMWSDESALGMKQRIYETKKTEPKIAEKSFVVNIPSANYTCKDFVNVVNYQIRKGAKQSEEGEETSRSSLDNYHLDHIHGDAQEDGSRKLEFDRTTATFKLTLELGDIVTFGHERMRNLLGLFAKKTVKSFIPPPNKDVIVLRDYFPQKVKHVHYNATKPVSIYFPNTCDLDAENRHVYIYADVIKPSRVGDTYAPLLRIVNVSSASEELAKTGVVYKEFQHRQYFPIREGIIKSIEVIMRTEAGDIFPFKGGSSILDLHFAKFKKN